MRAAGFFLAWAFVANAQNPPTVYLDLYSQLQQGLTAFDSTVTSQWNGSNAPIDLSSTTDQVYLELFGTGIRARGSLSDVRVSVGGVLVTPTYAGPQPQYPGMDQVNIPLPNVLAGRGELNIDLCVAGHPANVITINAQ
jgi:uncharacterized protein (TIGR03437 family)